MRGGCLPEARHDLAGEELHGAADLVLGRPPKFIQHITWPTPIWRIVSMWRATVSGEPKASVSATSPSHVIFESRSAMARKPGWSVGCASSIRSGMTNLPERLLVPHLGVLGLGERLRVGVAPRRSGARRPSGRAGRRSRPRCARPSAASPRSVSRLATSWSTRAEEDGVEHGPAAQRGVLDAVLGHAHLVERRVRPLHGLGDHARSRAPGRSGRRRLKRSSVHARTMISTASSKRSRLSSCGHAVAAELRGPVAAPHPDVEPAARDDVHQRHLLGEPERVVERQDGGGQADADPARARGGGARPAWRDPPRARSR